MGDVCDPRQLLDCFSGDGGRESASNETKKHMAGSSSILDYSAFWPILLSCGAGSIDAQVSLLAMNGNLLLHPVLEKYPLLDTGISTWLQHKTVELLCPRALTRVSLRFNLQ